MFTGSVYLSGYLFLGEAAAEPFRDCSLSAYLSTQVRDAYGFFSVCPNYTIARIIVKLLRPAALPFWDQISNRRIRMGFQGQLAIPY